MFCDIDDFCKMFALVYRRYMLQAGRRHRQRQPVYFHCSHYRTFKHDSVEHGGSQLRPYFPQLVSDPRFIALMPQALIPWGGCS